MSHPKCYNRPDFRLYAEVRLGWTEDGRRITASVPDPLSKGCQQWGELGEARLKNWNCGGCRHYPKGEDMAMKLFGFQPRGHGELSWFVMAETEESARDAVEADIKRRRALPFTNPNHIHETDYAGWGTDYYTVSVASAGVPLSKENA